MQGTTLPNFWTPSVTQSFFKRLCAQGTLHRQMHTTPEKMLHFLAERIGLTEDELRKVNPLDYEKRHMWSWTVPLTLEERSSMELLCTV